MKVYSVVVTYNGEQYIARCLQSLRESSLESVVVVIDNASTDHTPTLISTQFPEANLFVQSANLGFGAANNIGIRMALEDNADYVFLLNQDAYIEPDTLANLVEIASCHPDIGILSPMQYYAPDIEERFFTMFLNAGKSKYSSSNNLQQVGFIDAAVWLLPVAAIRKVGLFSPLFYHYGEDDNYCDRMLFFGYKICVALNQKAYHETRQQITFPLGHLAYLNHRFRLKLNIYLANPDSSMLTEISRLFLELWQESVRGRLKGFVYKTIVTADVMMNLLLNLKRISHFRRLSMDEGAFIQ